MTAHQSAAGRASDPADGAGRARRHRAQPRRRRRRSSAKPFDIGAFLKHITNITKQCQAHPRRTRPHRVVSNSLCGFADRDGRIRDATPSDHNPGYVIYTNASASVATTRQICAELFIKGATISPRGMCGDGATRGITESGAIEARSQPDYIRHLRQMIVAGIPSCERNPELVHQTLRTRQMMPTCPREVAIAIPHDQIDVRDTTSPDLHR